MSYRVTGSLPFLAVALAAPAAAQDASPACQNSDAGDTIMADSGKTTVIRSGTGHTARITRDGDGTIHVEQHGEDHAALVVQSGDGSHLAIDQRGATAETEVKQEGACNDTRLTQAGSSNRAIVSQSGGGNRAVVRQGPSKE